MSQASQEPAGDGKNYKDTLSLPVTDFPMRADLVKREPERLSRWDAKNLYGEIMQRRKAAGSPKYVLHDGPPFANGDVHMGTALNKVLKDLVIKSKTMSGFHAPFIPGWDCHGLPIEFKVVKEAQGLAPAEIRRRSEAYARRYIDIQRQSFRRLGVFGDWDHPYLTLDPAYEADIIRTFAKMVDEGLVYRSRKPVQWSYGAQTALAEAEVEYKEKTSPAVFVKFPLVTGPVDDDASLVIWTTTPWTLPANLGIAVHPEFTYVVGTFRRGSDGRAERLVVAKRLQEDFAARTGFALDESAPHRPIRGGELAGSEARHPFLDRTSRVITGRFVTEDTGTGAVHIAPGHGADDYVAGQEHGLGMLSPVDDLGRFTDECGLPELVGTHVFDANERIIGILDAGGSLLGRESYVHSYPHCWRSKTPIIFRAVEQFFIRIDALRAKALAEIDEVEWIPAWGRNRIYGTVESRPDWCISRQRTWGVPLPVFHRAGGETILDADVARRVADLVEKEGTNAWFELEDAELAKRLGLPDDVQRCRDTLDVWIDSGTSHVAVLERHPELHVPADLYLEATDQHRGWFQSSLMISVAVRGEAPYREVITHGFVIDNSTGEKISKSGDKPINASYYYDKYGADIVRLWCASVDFRDEVPFSDELFTQVVDAYRRIRNTLRILLGNLHGFDRAAHAVPTDGLTLVDRWILERLNAVTAECRAGYEAFEFRKVFNAINQFCAVDLSSLYIDITKDRMYCDAPGGERRRAAQTAMARVFDSLCRLLAPILAYTADEAWEFAGEAESVHLAQFPEPDPEFAGRDATALVDALLVLRGTIQREIDQARKAGTIGGNLEAGVTVTLRRESPLEALAGSPADVSEFLIISDLTIVQGGDADSAAVVKSSHAKCARCWRHEPSVGGQAGHEDLCARCAGTVAELEAAS